MQRHAQHKVIAKYEEELDTVMNLDAMDMDQEEERFKEPDEYAYREEKLIEYGLIDPPPVPDVMRTKTRKGKALSNY